MSPQAWQLAGQIVRAALQRPLPERSAYISVACAGNDALRQEVEILLRYYEKPESHSGSLLNSPSRRGNLAVPAEESFRAGLANNAAFRTNEPTSKPDVKRTTKDKPTNTANLPPVSAAEQKAEPTATPSSQAPNRFNVATRRGLPPPAKSSAPMPPHPLRSLPPNFSVPTTKPGNQNAPADRRSNNKGLQEPTTRKSTAANTMPTRQIPTAQTPTPPPPQAPRRQDTAASGELPSGELTAGRAKSMPLPNTSAHRSGRTDPLPTHSLPPNDELKKRREPLLPAGWVPSGEIFAQPTTPAVALPPPRPTTTPQSAPLSVPPTVEHSPLSSPRRSQPSHGASHPLTSTFRGALDGRMLGAYQLVSELNRSSLGRVYLAQDTRNHQRVALKLVLRSLTSDPQCLQQLENDLHAAAGIKQNNLLQIHEVGHQRGVFFVASEYVEGFNLRQLLARGKLAYGKALDITGQIASALAALHAAGLLHRRLRPENVMLQLDGTVKVLDAGFASVSKAGQEAVLRNPYLAPEAARGEAWEPRSDLFVLGLLLAEMVSGQAPFPDASQPAITLALATDIPLALASALTKAPLELQKIVHKALQKQRSERYGSAQAFAADVYTLKQRLDYTAQRRQQQQPVPPTVSSASSIATPKPSPSPASPKQTPGTGQAEAPPTPITPAPSASSNDPLKPVAAATPPAAKLSANASQTSAVPQPTKTTKAKTTKAADDNWLPKVNDAAAPSLQTKATTQTSTNATSPPRVQTTGSASDTTASVLPIKSSEYQSSEAPRTAAKSSPSSTLGSSQTKTPRKISTPKSVAPPPRSLGLPPQAKITTDDRANTTFVPAAQPLRTAENSPEATRQGIQQDIQRQRTQIAQPLLSAVETLTDADKKSPARRRRTTKRVRSGVVTVKTNATKWWQAAMVGAAITGASLGLLAVSGQQTRYDSLAVLPFSYAKVATAPADQKYLAEGLTDDLIQHLAELPQLRVISSNSVFTYRRRSRETNPQVIGKALAVHGVLTGRVTPAPDKGTDAQRVAVEFVDVNTGEAIWRQTYERKANELHTLRREILTQVTEQLNVPLTPQEQARLQQADTNSSAAYRLYLKGRLLWQQRTGDALRASIELFKEALALDPEYARAYAALAEVYAVAPLYLDMPMAVAKRESQEAASQAIRRNPQLAEPHTALGFVWQQYEWNWLGAEQEFKRALQINPNYVTAQHWYSGLLTLLQRHPEAVAYAERACALDPSSTPMLANLGATLYYARRYDEAIAKYKEALKLNPKAAAVYAQLGLAYLQKGKTNDALSTLKQASLLSQGSPVMRLRSALAYAVVGDEPQARNLLEGVVSQDQAPVPLYLLAAVYTALHEHEHALALLTQAIANHEIGIATLRVDPQFDALRNDERFQALTRQMGLA